MTMSEGSAAYESARRQRAGVRSAMQDLERCLASGASNREKDWLGDVASCIRRLDETWSTHIEVTEAPEGLFDEILDESPRLEHRIGRLRGDHVAIRQGIAALLERIDAAPASVELVEAVRDDAVSILTDIARHRHLGADLVYEAFQADIEAGD